ncbi:MAG: PP2C family protein-serine/threonine phosphatase [Mycobacteriales bacterium]
MIDGTLVLVEDDPGDALLVTEMLHDVLPTLHVEQRSTLAAALADWPARTACVLLDLGLPDTYELDGLTRVRQHAPEVPVVVLTGRTDGASGPEALAAGAQDYLVKGEVSATALERSVRYAIERGRALSVQRSLIASELRANENTRLQRGLLPSPLLADPTVRVAPTYRPGRERALLGGDFYDVVEADDGLVHLVIGDVSGHGPDEAALGVALRIAWRSLVLAGLPPQQVLQGAEQVLMAERDHEERFATCAMVSLAADRRAAWVRLAGHPAPLLVCGDGSLHLLEPPDIAPALTMVPGSTAEPATFALGESWLLLLYTDGLVEGSTSPGSPDRLGTAGLMAELADLLAAGTPATALGAALVQRAQERHGGPLSDDIAVVAVGSCDWWDA